MAELEYVGGGYFRERGPQKGEPAPVHHGMEALRVMLQPVRELVTRLDRAAVGGISKPGGGDAWPELAEVRQMLFPCVDERKAR